MTNPGQITRIPGTETAVLAGGCFWGMEDLIRTRPGVLDTRVGYTGGDVPNATYRNHPGHAEALEIVSANGGGMAKIHRVTDYGTHAIVDIELPDGTRLKSMTSEARDWSHGQPIDLKPRAFAAYRDNAAIHRSN